MSVPPEQAETEQLHDFDELDRVKLKRAIAIEGRDSGPAWWEQLSFVMAVTAMKLNSIQLMMCSEFHRNT